MNYVEFSFKVKQLVSFKYQILNIEANTSAHYKRQLKVSERWPEYYERQHFLMNKWTHFDFLLQVQNDHNIMLLEYLHTVKAFWNKYIIFVIYFLFEKNKKMTKQEYGRTNKSIFRLLFYINHSIKNPLWKYKTYSTLKY